jgi:hypothetical protein
MVGYDRCEGRSGGAKGLFLEAAQCRIRRALVALALRWGLRGMCQRKSPCQ